MSRQLLRCLGALFVAGLCSDGTSAIEADGRLPQLVLTSVTGQHYRLGELNTARTEVFVFLSPECPIACQYVPELNRLHQQYADQGVQLAGVISDSSISRSQAKQFAAEYQLQFPLLFDSSGLFADACRPSHVPEVFVFHQAELVYRGRIDNTYAAAGTRRQKATVHDLVDVLDSLVAGQAVAFHQTKPVGCPIEQRPKAVPVSQVTYNRDIAPVLHARCFNCHRDGEVAPFALANYNDASKRAAWIGEVVESGLMPPWRAKPGHGRFTGERHLSEGELALIKAWVAAGAPEGNPDDLPPLPTFASGWRLGEPDLVVRVPDAFAVPADGPDVFRNFALQLDIDKKIHVKAIEFRPGNPRVVHHALILCDPSSRARYGRLATRVGHQTPGIRLLPKDSQSALLLISDLPCNESFRTLKRERALIMSRRLLTITPSIVACARDYLHHSQSGTFIAMHIAECFALPSEQIVAAWDDAEFELRKRGQHHEFELVAVAVFKDGRCVAEYRNRNFRDPGATLLAGLDD